MASCELYLPLQHIIQVVPRDKPAVESTKSAIHYDGGNKQRQGSIHGLPSTHNYEDRRRNDKRRTDRFALIVQWKCGVYGVKPRRRTAQTPHIDDETREIHSTDMFSFLLPHKPDNYPLNMGTVQ